MRRPILALILLSVAVAHAEEPRTGRIVGRVRLAGPPPAARPPIAALIDSAVCGTEIPDESLVVDHDGGVANAVVVVRGVAAGAALRPSAPRRWSTTRTAASSRACRW